jgi:hypothetical protein
MLQTFNIVMRIVSSVVGLVMTAMGTIWILQGLNIAFRRALWSATIIGLSMARSWQCSALRR